MLLSFVEQTIAAMVRFCLPHPPTDQIPKSNIEWYNNVITYHCTIYDHSMTTNH